VQLVCADIQKNVQNNVLILARYRLRSETGTIYSVPRTRTKFGDRAFFVARPVLWNSLPAAVHHTDSLHCFKCRLKSHFFSLCFNDWHCNALQVRFRAWTALNYYYYYYHLIFTRQSWPMLY